MSGEPEQPERDGAAQTREPGAHGAAAPDDPATDDPATDDPATDDPATDGPARPSARRRDLHEANNRLAAIIMNLAFARATLDGSPANAPLPAADRADLTMALEHAESAANLLTQLLKRMP